MAYGAEGGDDGEGEDHGAGPGGDGVEVEVEEFGEEDDFRGDGGAGVVGELSEGGEVEFGEGVAVFGAAEFEADVFGGEHVGGIGIITHQLEGEVGFDGAGDVGRAAGVHIEAAVGLLEEAEVVGDEGEIGVGFLAEDELEEEVFGFKDGVALEFGAPVAVGMAFGEEGRGEGGGRGWG